MSSTNRRKQLITGRCNDALCTLSCRRARCSLCGKQRRISCARYCGCTLSGAAVALLARRPSHRSSRQPDLVPLRSRQTPVTGPQLLFRRQRASIANDPKLEPSLLIPVQGSDIVKKALVSSIVLGTSTAAIAEGTKLGSTVGPLTRVALSRAFRSGSSGNVSPPAMPHYTHAKLSAAKTARRS